MNFIHKISFLIHTASVDSFMEDQGIKSYFASVIKNLKRQTLKEFEFVYIDTFYDENKDNFAKISVGLPFIVKHVPVHQNHRYWYDKGNVYISAAKNTGIIYADGELCISCDDAEFFPDNFLELYWNHYKNKKLMIALHKRMSHIETVDGSPKFPLEGNFYVNDHRLKNLKENTHTFKYGNWCFAGTSFPLQDAIAINGYNEKMDGCKSLEDCDFGERLSMFGNEFIIDKGGILYIVDHPCYTNYKNKVEDERETDKQINEKKNTKIMKKNIENHVAVENYGVYMLGKELHELRANCYTISNKHLHIIQRETFKYRNFDIFSQENQEKLTTWLNTPNFDLKLERDTIRKSKDWRW